MKYKYVGIFKLKENKNSYYTNSKQNKTCSYINNR